MRSKLAKIKFYFPRISKRLKKTREFVGLLMRDMKNDGGIEYVGYSKDIDLYNDLLLRIGDVANVQYQPLNPKQKQQIIKTINEVIAKCHSGLPHLQLPIFVFVLPWFPKSKEGKTFGGVNAVAPYVNTMHLFISPDGFSQTSLKETIAHEFNHLIFYQYHNAKKYTLLEHIIIEGLAENFREEVMDSKPAPWAIALTKREAYKTLKSLQPILHSQNSRLHRAVLFGSKKYAKWAGYAIGYQLVKEFRKRYPKISWVNVLKMEAGDIYDLVEKK